MRNTRHLTIYQAIFLFAAAILFINAVNAQSVNKEWVGSYEFFDGQTKVSKNRQSNFITYTLSISQKDNLLSARFFADGTQTSDEYECSVQQSGDSIKIFFAKDLNEMNKERFKPFQKGDLLFTLSKTKAGKKTKFLFRAGNYEILPLSAVSKNKIYFEKKS